MHKVYLIIGGNLGNKDKIFADTIALIKKEIGNILSFSHLYESESWGFDSELFYNQVFEVDTLLSAIEVLNKALKIEKQIGRVRKSNNYEARLIDIDILFYDNQFIDTENLKIPHPLISQRRFVLVPLCEIAPNLIHPVTQLSVNEMLINCLDQLTVRRVE